jgi:4-amino-4-deoxy-L-arabinose transferase-like glycosyltransferase
MGPVPARRIDRFGTRVKLPLELLLLIAVAAIANFWSLTSVGWGNAYYSAAVRSMGTNWTSFLFNSFDSANYVTVDKPPLSLWVQVLSTKAFGWNQWAVLAPQAVAGVLAVVLLYVGIRRSWGRTAGFVSGLALAITPISVAVNHSNNTDAVLVLLMVTTAVAGIHAARCGRLKWLILASTFAGLAILAKMAAAAPVIPGVFLAYLWCAPLASRKRIMHAVVGVLTTATIGLSWFIVMEVIPDSSRPYIGSTQQNSAFELAFERNGINQVDGTIQGLPAGRQGRQQPDRLPPAVGGRPVGTPGSPGIGGPNGAVTVGFAGGEPGPLRLINSDLGTQSGWLIPLAVSGALSALCIVGFRRSEKLGALIIFSGWAVSAGTAFSISKGIVHPYYLAQLGPPIAALVGIGVGAFADPSTGTRRYARFLLSVGLCATAATQWIILRRVTWRSWQAPVSVGCLVVGVAIALVLAAQGLRRPAVDSASTVANITARLHRFGLLAMITAFLAPASWLQGSLAIGTSGPLPYAVPYRTLLGSGLAGIAPGGGSQLATSDNEALIQFLRSNRSSEKWLLGVSSAREAQQIVIASAEPIMAIGGFAGTDPISSEEQLRTRITSGQIRYFLATETGPGPLGLGRGPGRNATNPVLAAVTDECEEVPQTTWNPNPSGETTASPRPRPNPTRLTLFDCKQ